MLGYYFGFWGRLLTNSPHRRVWETFGNFGREGGGSVAAGCQELAHGRDRTMEGATRRLFFGTTEVVPLQEQSSRPTQAKTGLAWAAQPDEFSRTSEFWGF